MKISELSGFSPEEQRLYCEQAQAQLGLTAFSIEKDFWVCGILEELFSLPSIGLHLTFKGGTSLSKGWNFIQRFSEDIDIVIDRKYLGCDGDHAPESAEGSKERDRRLNHLKSKAQEFVTATLHPILKNRLDESLSGNSTWRMYLDENDPEQQTLLFEYTSVISSTGYIRPLVRIELGARSDTEPTGEPKIQSYLAQVFPEIFKSIEANVSTVLPKRTFWEKAMLLHEEAYRAGDFPPKPRLARHYYDLWCLISKGIADEALSDMELFYRIAEHRAVFFRKRKEAQDTLRPGSLHLMPRDSHLAYWRKDYQAMSEMFFGDVPDFDEILKAVSDFERGFNRKPL